MVMSLSSVSSSPHSVPYVAEAYRMDAFGLDSLTSAQPYTLTITTVDASGEIFAQIGFSAMASRGSDDRFRFTVGSNGVVMPPAIINVKLVGGTNINFSFESVTGLTYIIEYKAALNDANWVTLRTETGNGGNFSSESL